MRNEVAHLPLPKDFAIQIQSRGINCAAVEEVDEQPFAIARNRRRSGRRVGLFAWIRLAAVNLRLPDELPGRAIQAEHGLRLLDPIRGGEVNAIGNDRWRAVTAPRHGSLPENVFRLAPLDGRILSRSRDAVTRWPTPRRPVRRGNRDGCRSKRWPNETDTGASHDYAQRFFLHKRVCARSLANRTNGQAC